MRALHFREALTHEARQLRPVVSTMRGRDYLFIRQQHLIHQSRVSEVRYSTQSQINYNQPQGG